VVRLSLCAVQQDEYGSMDDAGETFIVPSFELEVGSTLRDVAVR
jgi:hypothetical protein